MLVWPAHAVFNDLFVLQLAIECLGKQFAFEMRKSSKRSEDFVSIEWSIALCKRTHLVRVSILPSFPFLQAKGLRMSSDGHYLEQLSVLYSNSSKKWKFLKKTNFFFVAFLWFLVNCIANIFDISEVNKGMRKVTSEIAPKLDRDKRNDCDATESLISDWHRSCISCFDDSAMP